MSAYKPLQELEAELLALGQDYAFADADKPEFEQKAAEIKAQIAAKKLRNAKLNLAKEFDTQRDAKLITRTAYSIIIGRIEKAKTEAELNEIIHFKKAA